MAAEPLADQGSCIKRRRPGDGTTGSARVGFHPWGILGRRVLSHTYADQLRITIVLLLWAYRGDGIRHHCPKTRARKHTHKGFFRI